ncbi:ferric reductase-like transmembrane domain-containing protein [Streptomyces poriticola]|uniref:ferric reductase-like transmembrane domain-containing protein n=1 Tax=Streptomyces poriticola TaxID=3120506 RepID=UPI002FCDFD83
MTTADGVAETTNNSTLDTYFAEFLNFGAGVLSLVLLSCSVIWGLVAQDRILLDTRRRIMAQAVHRITAIGSIVFLLVHIGVKLALEHTTWVAAVIPFGLLATDSEEFASREVLIGFGTLASLMMLFVGVTGALRNRFAAPALIASRWRAMHMLAYPAWCFALLHGIYAGRAAAPVFVILYGLSVLGVMAALALRAAPSPVKRKVADALGELTGGRERQVREELEESRARAAAGAGLPGYEQLPGGYENQWAAAPPRPRFEPSERPQAPGQPAGGFAAAYRAVSGPTRARQSLAAEQTARMELPNDLRPTEPTDRIDGGGSTSGSWPVPSPPPVGEAPPSAYDPLNDTGQSIPPYDPLNDTGQGIPAYDPLNDTGQGIPAYGSPGSYGSGGASGYGSSDVYDTGETNAAYDTYYPNDTYNSGPATETTPGASYDFDAPGSGEPWNTPSGGLK